MCRSGLAERIGRSVMTEPLTRADHYRKEAAKYHELAKFVRPAYLGDFYRRIASRYLVMAEDVLRCPKRGGEVKGGG